jgi:baseplate J-like protein
MAVGPLARYVCDDPDGRRQDTLAEGHLNGIDDVEVDTGHPGTPGTPGIPGYRTLLVRCLHPLPPGLREDGVRIQPAALPPNRPVQVTWAAPAPELGELAKVGPVTPGDARQFAGQYPDPALLVVRTDTPGDLSPYKLVIANPEAAGFDPCLAEATFSFGVDCDTDLDCPSAPVCPPARAAEPVIDYLSRDYAGLRQLLLDRLSTVAPSWTDRNAADTGVTLVEIFAYLGDLIAAAQDAISAEAYLGTARRRVSVARHARLLDYTMHQGAAARAWLVLEVDENVSAAFARRAACMPADDPARDMIRAGWQVSSPDGAVVFHTLHPVTPLAARNAIDIYTWGQQHCCLPRGATSATLVGTAAGLGLAQGDVLVFEEVHGAGLEEPPDKTHRWPVRLSAPPVDDYDPVTQTHVVEVTWYDDDRLPFPLCAWRFPLGRCQGEVGAAVARGNVVLAGHGRLVQDEPVVPFEVPVGGRYSPALGQRGLAYDVPYADTAARALPAARALAIDPRAAMAEMTRLTDGRDDWILQRDLLASDRFAPDYVAEPDDDGTVHLRFGDDVSGRLPMPGQHFTASYRVGGGTAGNVGRDVLTVPGPGVTGVTVRNPLPASGGAGPEPVEQVRQFAPQAFRIQERAVTDDDYATAAARDPRVQRAVGTRRWTGSWYTEFVTVDRQGGTGADAAFRAELAAELEPYRMAGSDIVVQPPVYVPVDIAMNVCIASGYFRGTVKAALIDTFSARDLPGGGRGFFHPGNFTFAQPVYLSKVVAAAMAVAGVAWVDVVTFQRFGQPPADELAAGLISMDRLEVALCDSEAADPAAGRISFIMTGGL